MKKIMKRVVALVAVGMLTITSFTGCANKSVDNNAVVATVGEQEIKAGLLNLYVRYQQTSIESMYGSYYGDSFWDMEVEEGKKYDKYLVESTLEMLEDYYVIDAHTADYKVALSEEELAEIDNAATAFVEANKDEVVEKISGQKEVVAELLRLLTINEKMFPEMTADTDRNVSDEEAAQKRLAYISFAISSYDESGVETKLSDDEIAAKKKEAEDVLKAAKEKGSLAEYAEGNESYTANTLTFDKDTTSIDAKVIEAADVLKEGEFANVIETSSAIYVVQLESTFDKDATATEKENIIAERENEKYTEVLDAWKKDTEIKVDKRALKQIDVTSLKITQVEEEEETTEDTTEDTTTEE